jgi:hypothetical protein
MLNGRMVEFESRRERQPVEARKAERELFFWTARQALKLVVLAALTVYLVVLLIEGRLPGGGALLRYL